MGIVINWNGWQQEREFRELSLWKREWESFLLWWEEGIQEKENWVVDIQKVFQIHHQEVEVGSSLCVLNHCFWSIDEYLPMEGGCGPRHGDRSNEG